MRQDSDWVTDDARHAGRVLRYHTWVVHHHQSVGEHCWQTYRIYSELWGRPDADVAEYLMHHDTAELAVGDPPYPVKMRNPLIKQGYDEAEPAALERMGLRLPALLEADRARVKVADLLEMTEHGITEREMGNLLAVPIVLRTAQSALDVAAARLGPEAHGVVRDHLRRLLGRHLTVLSGGASGYAEELRKFL